MTEIKFYSGGDEGSDQFWGEIAAKIGHDVHHYSFYKHGSKIKDRIELPQDLLNQADPFLKRTNKTLGRTFPAINNYTSNLLRRNFFQIFRTNSVFAITALDRDNIDTRFHGGTAWAIQLFIDKLFYDDHVSGHYPIHVYDLKTSTWHNHLRTQELNGALKSYFSPSWIPEKPDKDWTGIGTRALTNKHKTAIIETLGNWNIENG